MNKKQLLSRVGLVSLNVLLVFALLAIALPQQALAAGNAEAKPDPNAVFTAYVKNGKIVIDLAAPKEHVKFRVRVKDAAQSMPKYFNLGWLLADKKVAQKVEYALPKALKGALHLDVCLKNQINNRMTCQKVYNPGL
jgi:hypothetical protein